MPYGFSHVESKTESELTEAESRVAARVEETDRCQSRGVGFSYKVCTFWGHDGQPGGHSAVPCT